MWRILKGLISLIIFACICLSSLVACGEEAQPIPVENHGKIELRVGILGDVGHISLTKEASDCEGQPIPEDGESSYGDLKPVWQEISEALDIKIVEVETDGNLKNCDLVIGEVTELDSLARQGLLADISSYYGRLPDLKECLYENEVVFGYLGEALYGEAGLYFAPTLNEIPMPKTATFINEAAVKLLLDGDFEGSDTPLGAIYVEPYMPSIGSVRYEVLCEDGACELATKDYTLCGNIIELYRMYGVGVLTGEYATVALRRYIDQAYSGRYGSCRSDLFLGETAAYDADELCALLICMMANREELSECGEIVPLTASKEDALSMFSSLYGVRGLGTDAHTYIDSSGDIADCRTEAQTYEVLGRINDWIRTGILTLTENSTSGDSSSGKEESSIAECFANFGVAPVGEGKVEILPPIARWYDGENVVDGEDAGSYFRFSDSISRSSDIGIGISKKGTATSQARLDAALRLLNFAYTAEGRKILLCEGIRECAAQEAKSLGYGRPEDYLKDFYGAGLCFYAPVYPRFAGGDGSKVNVSEAISIGLVRSATVPRDSGRNWYVEPPRVLPYTAEEYKAVLEIPEYLDGSGANDGYERLADSIIRKGLIGNGFVFGRDAVEYVRERWKTKEYTELLNTAYYRLSIYYYEYYRGVEY